MVLVKPEVAIYNQSLKMMSQHSCGKAHSSMHSTVFGFLKFCLKFSQLYSGLNVQVVPRNLSSTSKNLGNGDFQLAD